METDRNTNIYNSIQNDFVARIAKENNNFIYGNRKNNKIENNNKKPLNNIIKEINYKYSDNIKKFNSKYKNLNTEFARSKNLLDFLEETSKKFDPAKAEYDKWQNEKIDIWLRHINQELDKFISRVFKAMESEPELKAKFLVARDEDYFYDDNDSNFFSRLFRLLLPHQWPLRRAKTKYPKHTVEPIKDSLKIFSEGKPTPKEVKQAGIGDCYLMAALISLAKKEPKSIQDCFVQRLDRIENEDNINIRFFYKVRSGKTPIITTINKKRVIMPDKKGALWPKLIEKAYAVYRKEHYEKYDTRYLGKEVFKETHKKLLDGGRSAYVFFAITGKESNLYTPQKSEDIIAAIKLLLDMSESVTCSFDKKFNIKDVKSKEAIKIHNDHAYAIVGIDETKKYVRMINPWKSGGRLKRNSPKSNEGGHIAMSYNAFKRHLEDIDYTIKR